jgi:hypothetical protein
MKVLDTPPEYDDEPQESGTTSSPHSTSTNTASRPPMSTQSSATEYPQDFKSRPSDPRDTEPSPPYVDESIYSDDAHTGIPTPSDRSEHDALPLEEPRCSLLPHLSAAWLHSERGHQLSTFAAMVLIKKEILKPTDLELLDTYSLTPLSTS